MTPLTLNQSQAASLLGVSVSTLKKLEDQGKIKRLPVLQCRYSPNSTSMTLSYIADESAPTRDAFRQLDEVLKR